MGYLRPVPFTRSTSWDTHKRRRPPSTEAGIDMFVPIGTPVLAIESGRVVDVGDSIGPATGRFVTIDLDDGRRVRYLHLSRRVVKVGDRVARGQVIGYSGATGYGEEDWSWNVAETGGAHVHMTLWPSHRYVFGSTGTLDPELYFDSTGSAAGSISTPEEERLIVHEKDEDWLNKMGQSIKDDVIKAVKDAAASPPYTEESYQVFVKKLQRALQYDVRPAGPGTSWELGPTIFELLRAADDSSDVQGVQGAVSAIAVKMTPEDRASIASSVAQSIKLPAAGVSKTDVTAAIEAGLARLVLKSAL